MNIFKFAVRHELTRKLIAETTLAGEEKDAEAMVERLAERWPNADVSYAEVEEQVGTLRFAQKGELPHPLDGMKASLIGGEEGQTKVRALEGRGVFRPGDVFHVINGVWEEG